jgi:hypothetical protein
MVPVSTFGLLWNLKLKHLKKKKKPLQLLFLKLENLYFVADHTFFVVEV